MTARLVHQAFHPDAVGKHAAVRALVYTGPNTFIGHSVFRIGKYLSRRYSHQDDFVKTQIGKLA